MFRLFDIFSVAGRKFLILNGVYDLRQDILEAHMEQIAAPLVKISPKSMVFTQYLDAPSDYQEYTISGISLEGAITVQAPEGYELHPEYNPPYTENVGWERIITITPDEYGTLPICTIQVRLNSTQLGEFNGRISHTSTNLITQYISLTGECVGEPTPVYTEIKYGNLYNFPSIFGTGENAIMSEAMATAGWHVPSKTEFEALLTAVGGASTAGEKLRENSTLYWESDEFYIPGTNDYNFNWRGAGFRSDSDGNFYSLKYLSYLCTSTLDESYGLYPYVAYVDYSLSDVSLTTVDAKTGLSVRLMRDATVQEQALTDGTACDLYVGIDGKTYRTVKIGTQVWMADNLAETKFRSGNNITNLQADSDWINTEVTYDDYYLPSLNDLQLIAEAQIQQAFFPASGRFWTSSEHDATRGYSVDIETGNEFTEDKDTVSNSVLAIRKFDGLIGDYNVGDRTPSSNYVFRVEDNGGGNATFHEVSNTNISNNIWSDVGTVELGTTYTALGSGLYNSNQIVGQEGHGNSSAQDCLNYTSAWYQEAYCYYDNDINNVLDTGDSSSMPFSESSVALGINYGRLYNYPALNDANFAPTDWKVPDVADLDTLVAYLGGNTVAGGKLKETGTLHWASPNTSADDSSGFSALPTGYRYSVNGTFIQMLYYGYIPSKTIYTTDGLNNKFSAIKLNYNSGGCATYALPYLAAGVPVRLLWAGTGTPPATITDYDGYVYDVVQVGTQYWLKQNWACTHLNNGTEIPEITDNSAWAAATSAARCDYNNDPNNV